MDGNSFGREYRDKPERKNVDTTLVQKKIRTALHTLEAEREIKVLFAVESGSRAWGFASQNSDWDVRFIYLKPRDWYLSIDKGKDSIEKMLPDDLDLSGWELRKALNLFRKSNPPLLEWLRSSIVYAEPYSTAEQLRELSAVYFNPKSCRYHYLSMARGNFREYLKGDTVRLKKYFYILRPLLACDWIAEKGTMAPMEFDTLVNAQIQDPELLRAVRDLTARKIAGEELSVGPQIEIINAYAENRINYHTEQLKTFVWQSQPDTGRLNQLFRDTLAEVWD